MKKFYLVFISFLFIAFTSEAQYNAIVAQNGSGNYTTVQAAINAAPTNSSTPWVIFISNGIYYEKITVPSNKPFLQLIGESVNGVTITYDDYAGKPLPGGGTLGTLNSASVIINATDFTAMNITFENGFMYDSALAAGVTGLQAVAVTVNADRSAFKNCKFIGMQDTLYTRGSGSPRHYFYKCYIDGIIDFIFGSSIAIFDSCTIYPKARTNGGNSYITAANTTIGQNYGYWFKDCKIPKHAGTTQYFLGRPWGNATSGINANNKVVLTNCAMSSTINPVGWSVWDAGTNTNVIFNAEYKSVNFDGSLVDISNRVSWSKQLTNADTVGYNILNVFNGWNPCSVRNDFCSYNDYEISIANFRAIKNGSNYDLNWNAVWAMTGVTYQVYSSTTPSFTNSTMVGQSITTNNDTNYNFSVTGISQAIGTTFYYKVVATKGTSTTNSSILKISTEPSINTTIDSINNFLQGSTAPSVAQSFIVNASNLFDSIKVVAPINYEISLNNTTWVGSNSYIKLIPTNNALTNTIIYVRLNAASAGIYSGNIVFTTPNISSTTTKTVFVKGETIGIPLTFSSLLQQYDMSVNDSDIVTLRNQLVQPAKSRLNRLTLSNGIQVPSIPAFSTQFGQAFGATANGDGTWSTASGGPGSNLNRNFYVEFTVKPIAAQNMGNDIAFVTIDSIILNSAFYNTASGTKLAVAYSKSNFTQDSAFVTGGRDLSGATLPNTAFGNFTNPILLPNQTGGPTAQYGLAFNGNSGVEIKSGDSLKIRLYYSCGSGSAGRYAMLKNVQIKGEAAITLPLTMIDYNLSMINEKQVINKWSSTNEVNVSHYNIQNSTNSKEFKTIGKVRALNKNYNEYSFVDENAKEGLNYYRIVGVDRDGKLSNSSIKSINVISKNGISIFPNPTNDLINLSSKEFIKEVKIINNFGQVVMHLKCNSQNVKVNLKGIAKGLYILQINNSINEKLMLQ